MSTSFLTPAEREVVGKLAKTFNAFVRLDTLHPDEQRDFTYAIHLAQRIVMARPVQRQFNAEEPVSPITGGPLSQALYCCLCFKALKPEECNVNDRGKREDVCVPCARDETEVLRSNASVEARQ